VTSPDFCSSLTHDRGTLALDKSDEFLRQIYILRFVPSIQPGAALQVSGIARFISPPFPSSLCCRRQFEAEIDSSWEKVEGHVLSTLLPKPAIERITLSHLYPA
jgi:hypothetical protein